MNKDKRLPGVSVITCTNRPLFFRSLLHNFQRQRYTAKELIIVLNKNSMKLPEYRRKVAARRNIKVFQVPERFSLGKCLNYGIGKAKSPLIAKFDDDDYYAPLYLREQVKALRRTGAGIVGKGAHLKYFAGKRLLVMTNPGRKNRFVNDVAGGTLLFKRQLYNRVRFAPKTIGEDTDFLRRSRAKGYKLFATSPNNFVGIRRQDKRSHTWKASDASIIRGSKFVAKTGNYRRWANRPVK